MVVVVVVVNVLQRSVISFAILRKIASQIFAILKIVSQFSICEALIRTLQGPCLRACVLQLILINQEVNDVFGSELIAMLLRLFDYLQIKIFIRLFQE